MKNIACDLYNLYVKSDYNQYGTIKSNFYSKFNLTFTRSNLHKN